MPISLLQKRKISGRGVLRLSLDDKGMKYYRLYLDVIRRPKNEFKNLNWEPPRGKYAFISFLKQGRVLRRFAMESLQEEIQFIPDAVGQAQLMLKCLLDTSNQTAINLGLALGAIPIEVFNPIAEFGELDIGWDEARIVCYADTAIEIALYGQKYDVCEESEERPEPGGPPVPIPPPVPPGVPIADISEPYDEETDDGLSIPNPIDDIPDIEPPPPELGALRTVTVVYEFTTVFIGQQISTSRDVYFPYYIDRDAEFSQLGISSATVVNGVWDGVTYEYYSMVFVGNPPPEPQYMIISVTDSTGAVPEIRVVPKR